MITMIKMANTSLRNSKRIKVEQGKCLSQLHFNQFMGYGSKDICTDTVE